MFFNICGMNEKQKVGSLQNALNVIIEKFRINNIFVFIEHSSHLKFWKFRENEFFYFKELFLNKNTLK